MSLVRPLSVKSTTTGITELLFEAAILITLYELRQRRSRGFNSPTPDETLQQSVHSPCWRLTPLRAGRTKVAAYVA
jgi:hypothetical protein